jgi:hypothetical protein
MRDQIRTLQRRVKNRFKTLTESYDFRTFSLPSFVEWLEERRQRPLRLVPWSLPAPLFGAWLTSTACDYVFYEKQTAPLHQLHIQIHEMAHILCEHPTVDVDSPAGKTLFRELAHPSPQQISQPVALRLAHSSAEEYEAERLASLIQQRILRYAGLHKLLTTPSSEQDLEGYLRVLKLD